MHTYIRHQFFLSINIYKHVYTLSMENSITPFFIYSEVIDLIKKIEKRC